MKIYAIDPGTTYSGAVLFNTETMLPEYGWIVENADIIQAIWEWYQNSQDVRPVFGIERPAGQGMPMGHDLVQTVLWSGRFYQCCEDYDMPVQWTYRRVVKLHLTGKANTKDSNVNPALKERLCEWHGCTEKELKGKKASPGPLYIETLDVRRKNPIGFGLSDHMWPALALALTQHETGVFE